MEDEDDYSKRIFKGEGKMGTIGTWECRTLEQGMMNVEVFEFIEPFY